VTFGSPKVGSWDFSNWYAEKVGCDRTLLYYTRRDNIVPNLPPNVKLQQPCRAQLEYLPGPDFGHSIEDYGAALHAQFFSREDWARGCDVVKERYSVPFEGSTSSFTPPGFTGITMRHGKRKYQKGTITTTTRVKSLQRASEETRNAFKSDIQDRVEKSKKFRLPHSNVIITPPRNCDMTHDEPVSDEDTTGANKRLSRRGVDYRGCLYKTRTGSTCLRWFSPVLNAPHRYCRNPNGHDDGIWCFVTPTTWELC